MFSVPNVTMNGGSWIRVMSPPLSAPKATHTPTPSDRQIGVDAVDHRELGHDDRPEGHDGAAREVDPGREDHQRLTDGQDATTIDCWTTSDRFVRSGTGRFGS